MRYVRLATKAEAARTALPDAVRAAVTKRIIAIAQHPNPSEANDFRLVAPAGENSGLVLTAVSHGR